VDERGEGDRERIRARGGRKIRGWRKRCMRGEVNGKKRLENKDLKVGWAA